MTTPPVEQERSSWWREISRGETRFDFVGRRRLWFRVSVTLVAISLLSLVFRQLNLGIEFEGGLSINGPNPAGATIEELRAATNQAGVPNAIIQLVDDGQSVRIQAPAIAEVEEDALLDRVAELTGTQRTEISVDAVGPSFGALILRRSMLALAVFLGAVMLYMTWRMEWKMAIAGIVALVHDLILTTGIYSLTGFEVTPATVVAILTILGYSLYDTVVVFDKVGEYVHQYGDRMTYSDLVNRSMNLVLARSLNTSLVSLLPVGSILFVGALFLGAATLEDFALALFVGIAASTYSSIFVAAPLLAAWKEREDEWVGRRRKLIGKATRVGPDPGPGGGPAVPAARSGAVPRPPRKRRR
ncbi:MAG TPA: protein translocase subunit SecF [Acidimicrobiia bacterium]